MKIIDNSTVWEDNMNVYVVMTLIVILLIINVCISVITEKHKLKHIVAEYTKWNDIGLTKEDLEFLTELQHEMITQDPVCQAAPRFWVVAGTKKEYVGAEFCEGEELFDVDGACTCADGIGEAVEYFQNYIEENFGDDTKTIYILEKEEYSSFDSWHFIKADNTLLSRCDENYTEGDEIIMETDCITSIDELIDALEEADVIPRNQYEVACYRNEQYRYPNTLFLTNQACKEHIRLNNYHYSGDAHSHAMTAWRSPEVERLWAILEKANWERAMEVIYGSTKTTNG